MIIETSDNRLFRVRESGDRDLAHCWIGLEVRRTYRRRVETFAPKAGAREQLVRKAATKIVAAGPNR